MNNDLDSSRREGAPMRRQRRSGRVVNGRDATGADTSPPGAAGPQASQGAAPRRGGHRRIAGARRTAVGAGMAAGGRGQGEQLPLFRLDAPHRVPVHSRQPDAPAVLRDTDRGGVAAAAAAGHGAGGGTLRLRLARLPQGDAGAARGRRPHPLAHGHRDRQLPCVHAQDPRTVADQSAGGADHRPRRLPCGGRPHLRGQQHRLGTARSTQARTTACTSSSKCSTDPVRRGAWRSPIDGTPAVWPVAR